MSTQDAAETDTVAATIKRVPYRGRSIMILDNEALIALGFLVGILAVTGGLAYFVVSRLRN
jgi:hypothetical protein